VGEVTQPRSRPSEQPPRSKKRSTILTRDGSEGRDPRVGITRGRATAQPATSTIRSALLRHHQPHHSAGRLSRNAERPASPTRATSDRRPRRVLLRAESRTPASAQDRSPGRSCQWRLAKSARWVRALKLWLSERSVGTVVEGEPAHAEYRAGRSPLMPRGEITGYGERVASNHAPRSISRQRTSSFVTWYRRLLTTLSLGSALAAMRREGRSLRSGRGSEPRMRA
jgi:hypothetical protein